MAVQDLTPFSKEYNVAVQDLTPFSRNGTRRVTGMVSAEENSLGTIVRTVLALIVGTARKAGIGMTRPATTVMTKTGTHCQEARTVMSSVA